MFKIELIKTNCILKMDNNGKLITQRLTFKRMFVMLSKQAWQMVATK